MAETWLKAEIQGVTPDLAEASGSFDAVDLGQITPERLAQVLESMTRMELLDDQGEEEICDPNLIVEGPMGTHSFNVQDDGTLFSSETGRVVTVEEALTLVTGQPFRGAGGHQPSIAPAPHNPVRGAGPPPPPPPPPFGAPFPPPPPPPPPAQFGGSFPVPPSPPTGSRPGPRRERGAGRAGPPGRRGAAFCSACGSPLKPSHRFCPGCGVGVDAPPAPPSAAPASATTPAPAPSGTPSRRRRRPEARDAGSDPEVTAVMETLTQMAGSPVRLHELRARCPFFRERDKSRIYRKAVDRLLARNPAPAFRLGLSWGPRDWALQKPGLIRRFMTLLFDFPLLIALMVAGVKLAEPFVLQMRWDTNGIPVGVMAISWFVSVYFGYYTILEVYLGASIGGLLMGLRVVDEWGNPLTVGAGIFRQFMRLFGLIALGGLASRTRGGQRGGLAALDGLSDPSEVVLS